MNRYLLMQICTEHDLTIANTFFQHHLDETVTYYDIGTDPRAPASVNTFAQLDVALVPRSWATMVHDVYSERGAPIPSHHFLTIMRTSLQIPKVNRQEKVSAALDTS